MSNSKKKIAIITGASQGIGKAIFELFQPKGIIAIGISRRFKNTPNTLSCDVSQETDIKRVVKHVLKQHGQIDILINNVGIVKHKPIEKETLADWNKVLGVNLTSYFLFCKHVLPHMQKRQSGKIINISSVAGRLRSPQASSAYVCSKYAIIGLTRQLAFQYAKDKIIINCVAPGQTQTPMLMNNLTKKQFKQLKNSIPLGRVGRPKEIAELVYFLTTDKANFMTGAIIDINGGQI